MVDDLARAARARFKTTGIPYYTHPGSPDYLCAFCGDPIPDGCAVAAFTDKAGNLTGVIASADNNPFTDANFPHICGAGASDDPLPDEIAHHDRTTDQARAMRIASGAEG